ncbi:Ribosome-recycling factor [bacterium HR35]|nr:Ribosome-recycling factor [bacterium HR35]
MINDFKKALESLLNEFKEKLKEIRGHRLNLTFLENLEIEVYGKDYPLKALGFLSQLDPLTFKLDVFDETLLSSIEAGLNNRNLGLSLSKEKRSLIIKFPPLTEETRKKIIKNLNELKEEIRIKARKLRDDFLKDLKAQKEKKEISEDNFYKTKEAFDKEIENFNKKVEELFQAKEKEILS